MVPISGVPFITLPPVYLGAIDANHPEVQVRALGEVVTISDGWFMLGTRVTARRTVERPKIAPSLPAR
ncbi:hypothetical protein GCM10010215_75520 [Streptomyces virginiae]|uniref:LysR substrate-binding domain-containing protein n=1 Tax=Streptomyces virginiae TaxID=1961 RepID=A0ABQ3NNY1_STRVG|nr:hypothetical protein GCM10010215_75520 [Streptomyces virginiae]GHI14480.1 hypothetical protein Scinn_39430 [Streptomyces virginiae]GLV93017.1 hypothetical protein Slala04_44710 [Streptomyces lavendulae subsp. lavendulae]